MGKKIKCDKCGKEIDARGFTLHYEKCKGKESLLKKCKDCKSTNIRLLNASNQMEKKYIDMGFLEVCEDCMELI